MMSHDTTVPSCFLHELMSLLFHLRDSNVINISTKSHTELNGRNGKRQMKSHQDQSDVQTNELKLETLAVNELRSEKAIYTIL